MLVEVSENNCAYSSMCLELPGVAGHVKVRQLTSACQSPKGLPLKQFCKASRTNEKFIKAMAVIDWKLPLVNALAATGLISM